MKVKTIGVIRKFKRPIKSIKEDIKRWGFKSSNTNPDMIICLGGDGTFLHAERKFPGIPKILIRESLICKKCGDQSLSGLLEHIKYNSYKILEFNKIEARINGTKQPLIATNEINLRNKNLTEALRFNVEINNKPLKETVIGDGAVIATLYGADAYFRAITKKTFKSGMGLAFNNPTANLKPKFLKSNDKILIEIARSKGTIAADNNPNHYTVQKGDKILIKKNPQKSRIVKFGH